MNKQRAWTALLFLLTAVTGALALLSPFISLAGRAGHEPRAVGQTPLLAVVLISLCLAVLLLELQGQTTGAKTIAALGILVAITAALRFIEVAIPGPAGFSPIFAPIILSGYVFGGRFGFLLGAMAMLVSAVITAGVGPWLPYQMYTAGWVGLSAGLLPHFRRPRAELALLIAFGVVWGFIYGAIMNLATWPFLAGVPRLTWTPGAGPTSALTRYAAYYLVTSVVWDSAAAAGNALMLAALGLPAVRALSRFRDRLQFRVQAA